MESPQISAYPILIRIPRALRIQTKISLKYRLYKNRRSAKKSRKKKKEEFGKLHAEIDRLNQKNNELKATVDELKNRLSSSKSQDEGEKGLQRDTSVVVPLTKLT